MRDPKKRGVGVWCGMGVGVGGVGVGGVGVVGGWGGGGGDEMAEHM